MFILWLITILLGISVFFGSFRKVRGSVDDRIAGNLPWMIKFLIWIGLLGLTLFLSIG